MSGVHLEVDLAVLGAVAGDFRRCLGVAEEFAHNHVHLTAMADNCGSRHLADRVGHFTSRWAYGMGLVAGDADHLADGLQRAVAQYKALEHDGVAAVRGLGG